MYYIGIDLGGTNVAAGIVNEKGEILAKTSAPTPKDGAEAVIDVMCSVSEKLLKDMKLSSLDIAGLGAGCPGIVDNNDGVIRHLSNLGMTGVNLRKELSERLSIKKISIENDANCAAMAEYKFYGNNSKSFIFITLGTGVGGGIILDSKVYSGFNGAGSEIGHLIIEGDGLECSCGCKGCWEQYASVTALCNFTKEAILKNPDSLMNKWVEENGEVNGRCAFDCAKKGDEAAKQVVDLYIKYIGVGITSIINVFQPQKIVIGGGISKEGDYLLNPLKEQVYSCKYNNYVEKCSLEIAKLFNDAGIIGAAFCAM